jgi:hypothetical protein
MGKELQYPLNSRPFGSSAIMEAVAKIKPLSLLDIKPQLLSHPAHSCLYKEIYSTTPVGKL